MKLEKLNAANNLQRNIKTYNEKIESLKLILDNVSSESFKCEVSFTQGTSIKSHVINRALTIESMEAQLNYYKSQVGQAQKEFDKL